MTIMDAFQLRALSRHPERGVFLVWVLVSEMWRTLWED